MQTVTRFEPPGTAARTFLRFGRNCRFETLWAWLTRCPATGDFPQTSHIWGMGRLPLDLIGIAAAALPFRSDRDRALPEL